MAKTKTKPDKKPAGPKVPQKKVKVRQQARREFERKYTAETNYHMLMDLYRGAASFNPTRRTRRVALEMV